MDTIGMDTNSLVADGPDAAAAALQPGGTLTVGYRRGGGGLPRAVGGFAARAGRRTTVQTPAGASLANAHSMHDNYPYRASFNPRNRPPETRP